MTKLSVFDETKINTISPGSSGDMQIGSSTGFFYEGSTGYVGLGTGTPDTKFHVEHNGDVPIISERVSSATGTSIRGIELVRTTTGTATAGIGVELAFRAEDGGGSLETIAVIGGALTAVPPSAEQGTITWELVSDSSLFTAMQLIGATGNVMNLDLNGYFTQDGIFGGIHVHDNSTSQSIPTGATYTKITAFADNEPSSNVTSDAANDKITITTTGIYRVEGSFSFEAGTANVEWRGAPFLNGVEQDNIHFVRKLATANDVGNAGFTGFIDVTTVPWDLDFRVRHDNGGAVDITVEYANLNVEYLGET